MPQIEPQSIHNPTARLAFITKNRCNTPMLRRIHQSVVSYGPAIFMIGAVVGTGSVTSMVRAGADHGMSLLWALALSCIFFWVMIESVSRLTFASGKTFVSLVKDDIGKPAAFYVVIAIVVGQFTSNVGMLGIVADAFSDWTGLNGLAISLAFCLMLFIFMIFGNYNIFERLLMVFVTVLGLSFLVNVFLVHPTATQVLHGLIPAPPTELAEFNNWALLVGGMVGTTLAGSVVVMRSFVVTDKGWNITNLPHARKDAIVSAILVFTVSGVIMACAAGTFHNIASTTGTGEDLKAIDMAYALVPLLGEWAATLFVVGIVAAGASSAIPNALVSIWSAADFFGFSRQPTGWVFRIMALTFCAAGLIVPFTGQNPVGLQLMSLALQAAFMPLLVLFILILLNRKNVVAQHKNRIAMNTLGALTFAFSCYTAYLAVTGLIERIHALTSPA